jgi:predicted SprT family Zn-dependent metalloprotease
MDLTEAARTAAGCMEEFGLADWGFAWNRRKRSLGLCRYHERRIELSIHFVRANEPCHVRETILHEIAHALAGEKAGHGPLWKATCLRVGCKPERCDKGEAIMPRGRWTGSCGSCGKEYWRYRRPARRARYWCRKCGQQRGAIVFATAQQSSPATGASRHGDKLMLNPENPNT